MERPWNAVQAPTAIKPHHTTYDPPPSLDDAFAYDAKEIPPPTAAITTPTTILITPGAMLVPFIEADRRAASDF
jgi:hypothetical protein